MKKHVHILHKLMFHLHSAMAVIREFIFFDGTNCDNLLSKSTKQENCLARGLHTHTKKIVIRIHSGGRKITSSTLHIKSSDFHHLHCTCLKWGVCVGGGCSGFLSAAGNRAELMGLTPCVSCTLRLSSFWNTAGYLKSLTAVALSQGLVQRYRCKLRAITLTRL